ncbi:MAG: adenosylmethionine--8-amino-7-oxononanoate transaminase [Cellvibrionaceae bacterium]|nr:adenosylmethionine--8-amino-7-oxononanoate transaminase [Cellvibrionaceae bacterium]
MNATDLIQLDQQHIWHPYSQVNSPNRPLAVKRAQGVHLELADGSQLIDGMSSWWSAIHGYNHPELNHAVQRQLENMAHVMFGGLTHAPAVELAARLVELSPAALNKVFFCDSGSVAVEVAMKMAIQYWQSQSQGEKHRFLSLLRGYHGDTFAAMSVCDPVTGMHHMFSEVLTQQLFTEAPRCGFDQAWQQEFITDFQQHIEQHHACLAAVILEPIVQGTGGMRMYSPQFLRQVKQLCEKHNVLLIADEIATGFGRTGKMFACEHAAISPDILCLGKALTGGYMSLAATLCTDQVAEVICSGEAGVFMHGPTFMGNPLACAVANKSIELLTHSQWQDNIRRIEGVFKQRLPEFLNLEAVAEVRCLGAIGVVELKQAVNIPQFQQTIVKRGLWLRPFGKLVYSMPPYIISDLQLNTLLDITYHAVSCIKES